MSIQSCPFCQTLCEKYYEDSRREYFSCPKCYAIFVPKTFHLNADLEKAEYDKHENHPEDEGYKRFLSRFYEPLRERIAPGSKGLDFGCGPGPLLAIMLEEAGHTMSRYDIFYHPDDRALQRTYDFISTTEVVEHLSDPISVLDQLWSMLKPDGLLGIMTKRVVDAGAFKTWHYKNDPTHVVFFHEKTFQFLAERWQCHLEFVGADVVFLKKPCA